MNLYYETVHSKAVSQCNAVSDAIEKCEKALFLINRQIDSVSSSWRGDSGAAMLERLQSSRTLLQGQINDLKNALTKLRKEADSVYSILKQIAERLAAEENHE